MTTSPFTSPGDAAARENWQRYQYGKDRGHLTFTGQAERCEDMYMGQGKQWLAETRAQMALERRPVYELNQIKPSVNSAIGYQIQNRMDIAFKPRGGDSDLHTATIISKVVMQVADQTALHWRETQIFSDGLIEQRGYFDVRMEFDTNIKGEIDITTLDPMDVIPDPDAKAYDPDDWADVIVTRWLTLDEIEQLWGKAARAKAEASNDDGDDFGDQDEETPRNKFGNETLGFHDGCETKADGLRRYRIIDRQKRVYEMSDCLVWPLTGDVQVMDTMAEDSIKDAFRQGAVRSRRMRRRVKWIVTTYSTTLHDTYSPYEHFTPVPYFAYFRRGRTGGMVDDAIGPQEILNKAMSQVVHIVNTSANSGWVVEENSLTNMTTEDLEEEGARTGLVVEYKKGAKPPQKIQPNQVPTGIDRIIDRADKALRDVTVPDAMRGLGGHDEAGIAIQAKQFASQQQLAVPLDNLAFSRKLLASRILKLVQTYYDTHRIIRITEVDPKTGKKKVEVLEINKFDPNTGSYLNDVTIGTYDVVITEQPMQVTFENSQFKQAIEMREKGIRIPDQMVVQYSNLTDKQEIIESMGNGQPPADPRVEAQVKLIEAQTRKADVQATDVQVKSQFSAIQTAQVIEQSPGTAPLADGLLKSAGAVDHDAGPIVPLALPGQATQPAAEIPSNTDPLTPASPARGAQDGIETPEADSMRPGIGQ